MAWLALASPAFAVEDCSDCVDDDGDGLVDCYDPECWGSRECPELFLDTTPPQADCGADIRLTELWRSPIGDPFKSPVIGDILMLGTSEPDPGGITTGSWKDGCSTV